MRRAAVLLSLAAAAAIAVTGAHALRSHAKASGPVAASLPGFEQVNFVSLCRFSHRATDDPIVLPGQFGKSHDHTFFGNTTTDANSTPAGLVGKASTCDPTTDTAAYWAPTLEVNGTKTEALDVAAYYRRNTYAAVKPFPAGFMMVGGSSTSFDPQSKSVVFWGCGLEVSDASVEPPNCGERTLRLHVIFPECWDGTRLDSPDHHTHMAYAADGICPADHPVALPQLVLIIRYPVSGAGGITVSSGTQYSGHADFVNAWDEDALTALVDKCLNALRPCGSQR
jgi:Domain of unknown function (DUF1996)